MHIDLKFQKKKISLASDSQVSFEHEQYSKKKILASTISGKENSIPAFEKTIDLSINKNSLKKGIKFVVESLFGILFECDNIAIFNNDDTLIDDNNLDTLISFFKKYPRTPLNIVKNSPINNDLHEIFKTYLTKVNRQPFEVNNMKFYDSNSGIIKVYIVKSKMIDLYLLSGIIIYLICLYVYTRGITNTVAGVKGIFSEDS